MVLATVTMPTITICDGCSYPEEFIFIHDEFALLTLFMEHKETGRELVMDIELERGVYSHKFEKAWDAGYEVTLEANTAEGRSLKTCPLCCSEVVLELDNDASYEEIMLIIGDLEDEDSYYVRNVLSLELNNTTGKFELICRTRP